VAFGPIVGHLAMGHPTSVVGRVVCKSYSSAPGLKHRLYNNYETLIFDVNKTLFLLLCGLWH